MSATTIRLKKEAGALFWPWCAVMAAGILAPIPYLSHSLQESLGFVGLLWGIPLLATLPFGSEFQHRTLYLLFSQPLSRMQIWREKLLISAVAILPATAVFYFGWVGRDHVVLAGLYVLAATASATFWTLSTRSTMGGLAVSGFPPCLVAAIASLLGIDLRNDPQPTTLAALSTIAFGYAGLTLWLGARKLARFQVTGVVAGADLAMAGPSLPDALTGWLRFRPGTPVLNLIRKEIRLLRILWLIAVPTVVYLGILSVLGALPDFAHASFREIGRLELALAWLMSIPIMGILAGCLSLGEERASGAHSWHLTLPIPAGLQWLIKLLVALFMGFLCATLLPYLVLLAGGHLNFGGPIYVFDPRAAFDWMYTVPILTLIGFWFSCAVSGTTKAAILFLPATYLIYLSDHAGEWIGNTLGLANLRSLGPVWLLVVAVAVIQSYWLFRTQPQDSILESMRRLIPVTLATFLCGVFSR